MAVTVHQIWCWRQQVLETLVRFYQTTLYLIAGESIVFKKKLSFSCHWISCQYHYFDSAKTNAHAAVGIYWYIQLKYKEGSSCHLSTYLIQNIVHLRIYPFVVQFRVMNWFNLFAYCFLTTFFTVSTSCGLMRSSPIVCGWLHQAVRGRMLWEQLQVSMLTDELNPN